MSSRASKPWVAAAEHRPSPEREVTPSPMVPMYWSLRTVLRYAVVGFAGVFAGGRAVSAYHAWEQWRLWRERDPSRAEGSLTSAEVDLAVAVLCIAVAGLIWWLLRPPSGKVSGGDAALRDGTR